MIWKLNKVNAVAIENNKVVLKGYFGNTIASFSQNQLTDVRSILKEGKRSVESDIYVIVISAQGKEFYTNYLNGNEASTAETNLKKLIRITI